MPDDMQKGIIEQPESTETKYKETPENDPLAEKWAKRAAAAVKHWEPYHKRILHSRRRVSGLDWTRDPDQTDFYGPRANLIHGTITAILPNIYARNPEISVTPNYAGTDKRLLCKTLEQVTNYHLENAKLKKRGKSSVKAALTCSLGIVKVMYQKDMAEDPIIQGRIPDTQDNINTMERLISEIEDPNARTDDDTNKAELAQVQAAQEQGVEVQAAEGLVIDRVMSEHWLLDTTVLEFWDYEQADWMIQVIPMKKATAEGRWKYKLEGATTHGAPTEMNQKSTTFSSTQAKGDDESLVTIYEIWDRVSQRVYTMAQGCKYFLCEPMSPAKLGERWYPFFVLPFQAVDGQVIGPSLVDLTEKLQEEHNAARDRFNEHRDLCKPGWNASADEVTEKTLKSFTRAGMGEINLMETGGKPVSQVIVPKQHPPIDPAVYDTSAIRYDWEQVSGMQDAARSSVVSPKTATEASIMQQSLSGRVSEFRDQVEDWLQEISGYAAQILLQELTEAQVERIMGPHQMGPQLNPLTQQPELDPATGQQIQVILKPSYDWPQLSRDEVFDLVQLKIRAGTTGEPDKIEQQETWIKLMPVIQPLIQQIMQVKSMGGDAEPLINLLRETMQRFDEKLDVEQFIPKAPAMPPAVPGMPPAVPGMPPQAGIPPGLPPQAQQPQAVN
jgi:hypothetical protein